MGYLKRWSRLVVIASSNIYTHILLCSRGGNVCLPSTKGAKASVQMHQSLYHVFSELELTIQSVSNTCTVRRGIINKTCKRF